MAHVRTQQSEQQHREQQHRESKYGNWKEQFDERPSPYKDLIQRDPVVCDNCFLLRYETINVEWWRGSFGWMEYNRWIPIPGRGEMMPAETTAKGTRLACSHCGFRKEKDRPIPKKSILGHAGNISQTLKHKGIEHDRETLFSKVQELNTSNNQLRQDSHVFSPAVKAAISNTGSNQQLSQTL